MAEMTIFGKETRFLRKSYTHCFLVPCYLSNYQELFKSQPTEILKISYERDYTSMLTYIAIGAQCLAPLHYVIPQQTSSATDFQQTLRLQCLNAINSLLHPLAHLRFWDR